MRIIITGVTGMVGEAVMLQALKRPEVEHILIVSRKAYGMAHPKITELIHSNFFDLLPIQDQFAGYDACFFCLGVTSLGKKEPEYTRLTYDLTMHFANTLVKINANMVFEYISGAGTDSSEKGRLMWARVKGKTENDLMKLPFKDVYAVRPGWLKPIEGAKNTHKFYRYIAWMYPFLRTFFKGTATSLEELGNCMINLVLKPQPQKHIEVRDIVRLGTFKP